MEFEISDERPQKKLLPQVEAFLHTVNTGKSIRIKSDGRARGFQIAAFAAAAKRSGLSCRSRDRDGYIYVWAERKETT